MWHVIYSHAELCWQVTCDGRIVEVFPAKWQAKLYFDWLELVGIAAG